MFPYIKPPAGTQINPLHPLSKGLVGYWLFNEGAGSLANDISGNRNHGRLTNMAPNVQGSGWGDGIFGGGLQFDGVNDYVEVVNGFTNTIKGDDTHTVMFWWKADTLTGNHGVIGASNAGSNTWWQIGTSDPTSYWWGIDGTYREYSGGKRSTGIWYHVTFVKEGAGDSGTLYENGIALTDYTGTLSNAPNEDGYLIFGKYVSAGFEFDGFIDSVRIYNRALSAEEVKILYLDPFCNMMVMRPSGLYVPVVGGMSIPVAMHYYNQLVRA